MTNKFKVGDKVRCIDGKGEFEGSGWELGLEFVITSTTDKPVIYWKGKNGDGVLEHALELAKSRKPQEPTHVVIWDEEDKDPHKFFPSQKDAEQFTKELSEKSEVIKDSIVLVEIKSVKKIKIVKSLKTEQFKI